MFNKLSKASIVQAKKIFNKMEALPTAEAQLQAEQLRQQLIEEETMPVPLHQKLHGFEFYKSIGMPKYVIAPMVDQSELPFRMLCRKYGATLGYTPMLHARMMVESKRGYKEKYFSTCPEDRPLITQFCGNDPDTMLAAAQMVEDETDAVDINLGCPQGIARKGNYGSFLLEKPDVIVAMTRKMHINLKVPVTCKIRILDDLDKTLDLAKRIERAGASILTVHGRTKEQNKLKVGYCDWNYIKIIKETVKIPVFANGGVYTYSDVQRCLEQTGVDGVMSAESLLENPALFSGKVYDLDCLASEYLDMWEKYDGQGFWYVKPHLFKILHQGLRENTDLREELGNIKGADPENFRKLIAKLKKIRENKSIEQKFGYYTRYKEPELTLEEFKSDLSKKVTRPNKLLDEDGQVKTKKSKRKRKRGKKDEQVDDNQVEEDNQEEDDQEEEQEEKENSIDIKQKELELKLESKPMNEDGRAPDQEN